MVTPESVICQDKRLRWKKMMILIWEICRYPLQRPTTSQLMKVWQRFKINYRLIACEVTISKRRQIIRQQLFSVRKNVRVNSAYLQRLALCKVELLISHTKQIPCNTRSYVTSEGVVSHNVLYYQQLSNAHYQVSFEVNIYFE